MSSMKNAGHVLKLALIDVLPLGGSREAVNTIIAGTISLLW